MSDVTNASETRVYLNGFAGTRQLAELGVQAESDLASVDTLGSDSKAYLPGTVGMSVSLSGFVDVAEGQSFDALAAEIGGEGVWTICPAGDTFGAPADCLLALQSSAALNASQGEAVTLSAEAVSQTGFERGLVLLPASTETAGITGADLDNGTSSTAGAVCFLQLLDVAGAAPALTARVQHSADGITWVDLATFTAAAAAGAQRISVAGTVQRHLRATTSFGGTTSSATAHVSVVRN